MPTKMDLTTAQIAATAASINLFKALMDYSASGPLADAAGGIKRWLIQEGISDNAFKACRDLAANCARPNEHGQELQRRIDNTDKSILERLVQAPLDIVTSGSLGRLVGRLPEMEYMVTTVASLVKVHRIDHIVEILCAMMLDRNGEVINQGEMVYDVRRTPLRATISKVVESIYQNVSNPGHTLDGLPAELCDLHQHLLDETTFAGITIGIQRKKGNILIKSDRFLADLTLWLMYHFDGVIEVYLQTKLYSILSRGEQTAKVILMIESSCQTGSDACFQEPGNIQVSISSGSQWSRFMTGSDNPDLHPVSYQRQALYELDDLMATPFKRRVILTHEQRNLARDTAQTILGWLLNLTLTPNSMLNGLAFKIDLHKAQKSSIQKLFPRLPGLFKNASINSISVVDWSRVDHDLERQKEMQDQFIDYETTFEQFSEWFPMLRDAIGTIIVKCPCSSCQRKAAIDVCKIGCYRYELFYRVILLLVHGLCDATGANDVSGEGDPAELVSNMVRLLSDVVRLQILRWDDVFAIVSSAITGVSFPDILEGKDRGVSTNAAVQYGSLVVSASWLDLTSDIMSIAPFSITVNDGNIQGITSTYAILESEAMTDASWTASTPTVKTEIGQTMPITVSKLDPSTAEVYVAIFASGTQRYRLMTCVSSGTRFAVVDPAMAVSGHWSSIVLRCTHRGSRLPASILAPCPITTLDFEAAFDHWHCIEDELPALAITSRLDSHLKLNSLVALSSAPIISYTDKSCLQCALEEVAKNPLLYRSRRIIGFGKGPQLAILPGDGSRKTSGPSG